MRLAARRRVDVDSHGRALCHSEQPAAPVFIGGKKAVTLRGPTVAANFKKLVIDYIERRYGADGARQTAAE